MTGLSLALALRHHGIEARVYERSGGLLTHEGAGLMVAGPTVESLDLHGTRRVTRRYSLGASGGVLWEQTVEKHAVGWGDVYGTLRRRAHDIQLHEDCPVLQVDIDPPRIRTERFGEERFDLVIGADGIGSVVRARLDPDFAPHYMGYLAVRGLVPLAGLPQGLPEVTRQLFDDAMAKVHLDGEHVTMYGLPGEHETLNWMWYVNVPESALGRLLTDRHGCTHRWSMPAGAMRAGTEGELRTLAAERLPPWLAALVDATQTLFLQPIFSGFADRILGSGLVLAGDAAHLAIPHAGGGVTLALQDTSALAASLAAEGEDQDAWLQAWARARQAANTPRLAFAARLGRSLQTPGKDWETWSPMAFAEWWTALLADAPADASR